MEKIKYYIEKYKLIIFLISSIVVLISLTIYIYFKNKSVDEIEQVELIEEEKVAEIEEEKEEIIEKIRVDIKGLVKNPGVYEVVVDSRVIDVINKAGGLKSGANTEYINLSKKVKDEMVIIIYSNSDVEKFKETDKQIIYIEYECVCPDNKNDACINENDVVNTNGTKGESSEIIDDKVSINKATLEELMTLNGIGESKAKAIIEYRNQNGEFKNIEDIMNVSGIGELAYSKIKDNIKL
jgi:competence protein ComEA